MVLHPVPNIISSPENNRSLSFAASLTAHERAKKGRSGDEDSADDSEKTNCYFEPIAKYIDLNSDSMLDRPWESGWIRLSSVP